MERYRFHSPSRRKRGKGWNGHPITIIPTRRMASEPLLVTPLTKLLGIKHPVLLAGMGIVSNPELVAAVCNAGGMGVLGGVNYSPASLRKAIAEMKSKMTNPKAPFGVDLLIPQVGGNARKTNKVRWIWFYLYLECC